MRTTRQSFAFDNARLRDNDRSEDITHEEEKSNSDNDSVHFSDEDFIASSDDGSDDDIIETWAQPLLPEGEDDRAPSEVDVQLSNGQSINGPIKKRRVTKNKGEYSIAYPDPSNK